MSIRRLDSDVNEKLGSDIYERQLQSNGDPRPWSTRIGRSLRSGRASPWAKGIQELTGLLPRGWPAVQRQGRDPCQCFRLA